MALHASAIDIFEKLLMSKGALDIFESLSIRRGASTWFQTLWSYSVEAIDY
jgi:hypothetical protein